MMEDVGFYQFNGFPIPIYHNEQVILDKYHAELDRNSIWRYLEIYGVSNNTTENLEKASFKSGIEQFITDRLKVEVLLWFSIFCYWWKFYTVFNLFVSA